MRIREQCKKCNEGVSLGENEECFLEQIMEEFDEYIREAEVLVKRAKSLKETASSTARIVGLLNSLCE